MTKRKTEERMHELARKWQEGTITDEEKLQFEQWYQSFDDTLLEETSSETTEELRDRLYHAIVEKEKINSKHQIKPFNYKYFLPLAATVLLFLSFGLYFYIQNKPSENTAIAKKTSPDIAPGTDKAILTLADGSRIVLDQAKQGVLANQGNISIRKNKDGQIVYEVKGTNKGRKQQEIAYNTITTPRGGQYQIDLPDGTKVWLNASSSIKFPAVFSSNERRVELKGEAYFEVAKMFAAKRPGVKKGQRIPFIVKTASQDVEVLGTHFNVNAYDDEEAARTTLLEGSVRVTQHSSHASRLLRPGQQTQVDNDISVLEVDPQQVIAWKNGYFVFNNENVQSIMRKISRWYDVDVEYQGNIQRKRFGGTISKFENVSAVLNIMELTGVIRFKIEGRRIIVMP
ncbi:FecR family protein [Arcticibacter tournemirensis]|uniref:DUF4974 domain-containing protein n=1 Tax=Arcticibacter tournemirensis TaxID=699437 RepID=A0A5M9H4E0_9SPHI|nr:FecR family protein [Arcticibacter tournemirensis]KAA8481796.1 DUF4974 domain-containing protein [Arcticibacter tournemirensis]TQM50169.1 FecR family protein [Arcticibacter tournemirensis]